MEWIEDSDYYLWYTEEVFEGYTYRLSMSVHESSKSIKFWVGASSGKKRKDKNIYHDKENKSLGGIKSLFWIKRMMYEFPIYYTKMYPWKANKTKYICVGWADNRRRDIYQRLQKEGFQFIIDEGRKILMKKL